MNCPITDSLDELIGELSALGYVRCSNAIDAEMARSGLSVCTNCGGRGCFSYRGMRRGRSYRAFLACVVCHHWIEI